MAWMPHIRRRLRALILKDWKSRRTMAKRLTKLGSVPDCVARHLRGAQVLVGAEPQFRGGPRTAQRVFRRTRPHVPGIAVAGLEPHDRRCPGAVHAATRISPGEITGAGIGVSTQTPASEEPDVRTTSPVL